MLMLATLLAGLMLPAGDGIAASAAGAAPKQGARKQAAPEPGLRCNATLGVPTAVRPRLVRTNRPSRHRAKGGSPPPQLAEEPPAVPLRAFYTCTTIHAGPGWRPVGPVRRS